MNLQKIRERVSKCVFFLSEINILKCASTTLEASLSSCHTKGPRTVGEVMSLFTHSATFSFSFTFSDHTYPPQTEPDYSC